MYSSSSSSVDPMAALGDAWRHARQALSFSSVRGQEVTGTHVLRIDGYSTVDSALGHGKCVDSKPFRAGGHWWKLSYYPNGYDDSKSGRPSVLLRLQEKLFPLPDITASMRVNATAAYDVSVLDVDGEQLYHNAVGQMNYSTSSRAKSASWIDLSETKAAEEAPEAELKEALRRLKGDSVVVRCDVTVKRLEEESRIRWLLRRFLD